MLLRRYVYITLLLKLLVVLLLLYLFEQHVSHSVIGVLLRLSIYNLWGDVITVDLGHSHLIELWVLRLLYCLERLHYASDMLLSIKVQSTSSSMSLYGLKLGINQIVAVKSAIFWTGWPRGIQPRVCISIFTIGIVASFFSFGLASLHIIVISWRRWHHSFITLWEYDVCATGHLVWSVYMPCRICWWLKLGHTRSCRSLLSNVTLIAALVGAAWVLDSGFLRKLFLSICIDSLEKLLNSSLEYISQLTSIELVTHF